MIREELLGKHMSVLQATNTDLIGLQGEIINETKKTLRIHTDRGTKTVLKNTVSIQIQDHVIDGEILVGRPHERTKIKLTKWHKKTNQ